jgi:hypothetical protein
MVSDAIAIFDCLYLRWPSFLRTNFTLYFEENATETPMRLPPHLGSVLLAIWLILIGLSGFINLGDLRKGLDILALAAGILMLLSR